MLVAGRIIVRISVGLTSAVVPIYQLEATAPAIQGRIVSLQEWYTRNITFNKLMEYYLGLLHGAFSSNTSSNSVAPTATASRKQCLRWKEGRREQTRSNLTSSMSSVLNVSDSILSRVNQPKELPLR